MCVCLCACVCVCSSVYARRYWRRWDQVVFQSADTLILKFSGYQTHSKRFAGGEKNHQDLCDSVTKHNYLSFWVHVRALHAPCVAWQMEIRQLLCYVLTQIPSLTRSETDGITGNLLLPLSIRHTETGRGWGRGETDAFQRFWWHWFSLTSYPAARTANNSLIIYLNCFVSRRLEKSATFSGL